MAKPLILENLPLPEFLAAYRQGELSVLYYHVGAVCNLACLYCNTGAGRTEPDELTLDELKSVLDQAQALGARYVVVAGKGEPLADPKFLPALRHSHELGLKTILFTNGLGLTESVARQLFEWGANPVVKVESLDPAVHDSLVGVEGALERTLAGLDNLLEAGYAGAVMEMPDRIITRLGLSSVATALNYQGLPELARYCREHNLAPYIGPLDLLGRAVAHRGRLPLDPAADAWTRAQVSEALGYPYTGYSHEDCLRRRLAFAVDSDGQVIADGAGLACYPQRPAKIGNVRSAPVAELHARLAELRRGAPEGPDGEERRRRGPEATADGSGFQLCPLQAELTALRAPAPAAGAGDT